MVLCYVSPCVRLRPYALTARQFKLWPIILRKQNRLYLTASVDKRFVIQAYKNFTGIVNDKTQELLNEFLAQKSTKNSLKMLIYIILL